MTTTARSIIERAHVQLHDVDGVRWPAYELVAWLNDAQRAYVQQRPDQKCTTQAVSLTPGFRQSIPSEAVSLIDIPNNSTGAKRRITKIDMLTLDAVSPTWRSANSSTQVVHFMHDLREPRVYHVYPPAAAGAQVDITYSLYPVDVPVPALGGPASTVTGDIDLSDHTAEALLNFVLFKAYSKDAEFGGNAQMAASYLAMFNAAVGSQLQSTATVAPQT
jgi:hypothetical protein